MLEQDLAAKRKRARKIIRLLHAYYPDIECSLDFRHNPFRLLVGAILAAQCTDARVNMVTPDLFAQYPDVQSLAEADVLDIERLIRSCGLFRMKAKNIKAAAAYLMAEHAGELPSSESALLKIPGVGRKIANLILGDSFGQEAVVVDTHCARISALLGFTESKNPTVIEKDLQRILPPDEWTNWGHLLVTHGRDICVARRPACLRCPIQNFCPYGLKQRAED